MLVPDFSGIALNFSHFNLMFAVDLMYLAFIIFRCVPCTPDLSKTFYHEGAMDFLSKVFSASNEMIMWFFFFQFVFMVDYINRFLYDEPSLTSLSSFTSLL